MEITNHNIQTMELHRRILKLESTVSELLLTLNAIDELSIQDYHKIHGLCRAAVVKVHDDYRRGTPIKSSNP